MPNIPRRRAVTTLFITLITVIAAPALHAAGAIIGCLCLDNVHGREHRNEKVQGPDGAWIPWTYAYDLGDPGGAARLYVFDRPVPPGMPLMGCAEVVRAAKTEGANLLLAGTLNHLKLRAFAFEAVSSQNRFQIDPKGLDAELGHVISGAQRIGGGSLKLAGARLYLSNPTRLLALADRRLTGTMEIEAWNRTIADATVQLPGGGTFAATFAPVDPDRENVAIRVDMETGKAMLWRGRLRATPPPLHAASLSAAALTLDDVQLSSRNVFLTAENGALSAAITDAGGKAARATLNRRSVTTVFESPSLQWRRAESGVQQSPDALALAELSLSDAAFRSKAAEVRTGTGAVALKGAADAHFATLTPNSATGTAHWTQPEVPTLPFVLPAASLTALDIELSGNLDAPRLRGSGDAKRFAIGPIGIENPLTLAFDFAGGDAELRFPLRFTVGPVGVAVTIRDPNQEAAITATITRADLNGNIVLTWPDLEGSRLEVPADRLHFALANTVATKPLLAGTAPAFGSARVAVVNSTAIVAAKESSGALRLTSDVLVLSQPIVHIGDQGHSSASTLRLSASGAASARYDLATGRMALLKGSFLVRNFELGLLDPNGSIDLSGTILTAPRAKFDELAIDIDEEAVPRVSRASIQNLSIDASHVARPFSAQRPQEVTFEAVPSQPLTIESVEASKTFIAESVDMNALTVRAVDFHLRDAAARFGGGFNVDDGTMRFSAMSIAGAEEGATTYTLNHVSFDFAGKLRTSGQLHINDHADFHLQLNASGRSDHLDGTGHATIGAFSGSDNTDMPIEAVCKLNLPVEYNFAVGGADMRVTVRDGAFEANADLAPLGLLLHSTSGASCNTPTEEVVISAERKISTTGICCCPLDTCEWSVTIPKVAFNWHKRFQIETLGATAVMTNPRAHLADGRLQVCNVGAVSIGPPLGAFALVGGVSPQIDTNFPGADAIVNPLIAGLFTTAESLTATAVANGAGFFASSIATPAGNVVCLRP